MVPRPEAAGRQMSERKALRACAFINGVCFRNDTKRLAQFTEQHKRIRLTILWNRLARLPVLTEQVADQVEDPAVGLLVEAVGDHAIALAFTPGLQTELEPLCDALRAGRVSVPQPEFANVSSRHHAERHVEAAFGRLDPVPEPGLKRPALGYPPLLRLVEAGGELQPISLQILHLPANAEVADALLVQETKRQGEVGLALRGGCHINGDLPPGVGAAGDVVFPDDGFVHEQLFEMIARGARSEVVPLAEAETLAPARPDCRRLAGADKITRLRRSARRVVQFAWQNHGGVIQQRPRLVNLIAVLRVSHHDPVNDLAIVQ